MQDDSYDALDDHRAQLWDDWREMVVVDGLPRDHPDVIELRNEIAVVEERLAELGREL